MSGLRASTEISYWSASAMPASPMPRLEGDLQTDTVIIGGGYTGLSAARDLARSGVDTLVLEAKSFGFGASGRNGGFVSTRFRIPFSRMATDHGQDVARRMYDIGQEAADHVERTMGELTSPECGYARYGAVTAALNAHHLQTLDAGRALLERAFGDRSLRMLSRGEIAEECGSERFVGGMLSTRSGGIHPLNYVRVLTKDLRAHGVPMFEDSPATAIRHQSGGVLVQTPAGTVRARRAIIGTNAYSETTSATDPLGRRVVPLQSACIATAPLPDALLARLIPRRRLVFDSKRVLRWFRIVADRMVFGGRGESGAGGSDAAYRRLYANMVEIFPELAGVAIAYRWSGHVAMTLDTLPHVGWLDDRVLYAIGYNGTGVAMASLLGTYAARLSRGERIDLGLLGAEAFRPIRFHALYVPVGRAVTGWYQLLDALGR